ncbi:class I SAM-dependent methyltransferase [Desertibacillus haloalkaliphilus]|nr:class I SAM-dependent methyltransferase [Desertibacillus haloalkaliphilus]
MASLIQEDLQVTYLEALAEAGESLFQGEVVVETSEGVNERVKSLLSPLQDVELEAETVRKVFQLAVLKGMKEATQPHHAMTPDGVALFVSYLVNKVMSGQERISLLDPAVGTANLLSAIINQSPSQVRSYGFEVDETLLKLAFVSTNLQAREVGFFHQDSIRPIHLSPVDLVVSDLPVGYYPNDDIAEGYQLKAKQGHSYSHHLLIEQSINSVKEGGFLIFIIPNFLFSSEEAPALNDFIKEHAVIHGLLQLPPSMFKSEQQAKSIFMLQKKGENVITPRQALMAELPSFSNKQALADMIKRIDDWFEQELHIDVNKGE